MRITKQELFGMFRRLMRSMDINIDENYKEMQLDYARYYGGYKIVKIGENGEEIEPFGSTRRTAAEMYYSMLMAAQALEIMKNEGN